MRHKNVKKGRPALKKKSIIKGKVKRKSVKKKSVKRTKKKTPVKKRRINKTGIKKKSVKKKSTRSVMKGGSNGYSTAVEKGDIGGRHIYTYYNDSCPPVYGRE